MITSSIQADDNIEQMRNKNILYGKKIADLHVQSNSSSVGTYKQKYNLKQRFLKMSKGCVSCIEQT